MRFLLTITAWLFQVNIILLPKARRTNTKKYQVTLAGVGNALFNTGGNIHDVQRPHLYRRCITDPDLGRALENHVKFKRAFHPVQPCRNPRLHACPGYGAAFIRIDIMQFGDITALIRRKFRVRAIMLYVFHTRFYIPKRVFTILTGPLPAADCTAPPEHATTQPDSSTSSARPGIRFPARILMFPG